jgi:hypothetical protein
MKVSPLKASKPGHIICPACGSGELGPQGSHLTVCDACGVSSSGAVLRTLEQIAALPEGLGHHACECGHPEMRHLPDGVFIAQLVVWRSFPANGPWLSSRETLERLPREAEEDHVDRGCRGVSGS